MTAPEQREDLERVLKMVERLQPILRAQGSPRDVLSACMFIAGTQAKATGRSFEQFLDGIRGWCALAFDQEEGDSWRKPTGEPPVRSLADLPTAMRAASRLVFERILPAIRGQASGPLIAGLAMALIDVARAQNWPLEDILGLVRDIFQRHESLDPPTGKA